MLETLQVGLAIADCLVIAWALIGLRDADTEKVSPAALGAAVTLIALASVVCLPVFLKSSFANDFDSVTMVRHVALYGLWMVVSTSVGYSLVFHHRPIFGGSSARRRPLVVTFVSIVMISVILALLMLAVAPRLLE